MPLKILSYDELYGWTMDAIVAQIGKKNNCTFCGVFRRQALDRGAAILNVDHIVTGHNADDIAETVLMNSKFYSSTGRTSDDLFLSSHARRYRPPRTLYFNLHTGRRHDKKVEAFQVRVREGDRNVGTLIRYQSIAVILTPTMSGMRTSSSWTTSQQSVYTRPMRTAVMQEHFSRTLRLHGQVLLSTSSILARRSRLRKTSRQHRSCNVRSVYPSSPGTANSTGGQKHVSGAGTCPATNCVRLAPCWKAWNEGWLLPLSCVVFCS